MAKQLTTPEVLATARAQDGGGATTSEPPATPDPAAAPQSEPAKAVAAAGPSATPSSPADILAAARAQAAAPKPAAPSSPSDILAAARAQAGAAPAAKPTGAGTPAAAKAKPTAAAPKLSTEEMLKQLRGETRPKVATETDTKPSKPKLPGKPLPKGAPATVKKPKGSDQPTRRNFLVAILSAPMALAWTFIAMVLGGSSLALARFMFPNVLVEPPSKFKVGPPSDYPLNAVSTKWKPQFGVWLVHTNSYDGRGLIYALASVCTHLGCTPNWLEGERKFKCPCHGSGFYMNGINFEGPAPRPLERVGLTLAPDGMLEVDKSLKFQEELGQWADESSYVEV